MGERRDPRALGREVILDVLLSAAVEADHPDADVVIGAVGGGTDTGGQGEGAGSGDGGFEE